MSANKLVLHATLYFVLIAIPVKLLAAPGTLANVPLFTQANADPNILLHLDSSGSMRHIVPELPYDSSVTYDADPSVAGINKCATPLAAKSTVILKLNSSKLPTIGGKALGNASGEVCFAPNTYYYATLHTSGGSGAAILYSGNYLNWYFNANTTLGVWQVQKPNTRNRLQAAKKALSALVDSMSNVRAGLTSYDGSLGARLRVPVGDIAANKAAILTGINNIGASGYTPLAETLRDIGRYFSNDKGGTCAGGKSLSLHPGQINQKTASCTNVLSSRVSGAGPVQYFCQKNFTILITDGLSTQDQSIHADLQDYDQDCSATAEAAGGYTCGTNDKKSNVMYEADSRNPSDYLDDVAQALFEIDLRPDMLDHQGQAVKNNMRTYVIGFADESVKNNPLLVDTAKQGGGDFIYAEDTDKLIKAFQSATQSILGLIGSSAAVTFNSATLSTNSSVYLALFNSSDWSGNLVSYDLNDVNGAITTKNWDAASKLDELNDSMSVAGRTIISYNGKQGVPFRTPLDYQNPSAAELSILQLNDLLVAAPYSFSSTTTSEIGANQTYANKIINYFRGERVNEGSGKSFRARGSRLGDVIHGGPVFVGAPELYWPDGNGFPQGVNAYSVYKFNSSTDANPGKADRPGVVYLGGNDGMLHGFVAEDSKLGTAGTEILAYIPKALFSTDSSRGLHFLADKAYTHQYYVDLTPTITDVFLNNQWRTLLIGGLRGGGRGIYVLDVSEPEKFSEANAANIVIGEFTNKDDIDLGYTFSEITVALMPNGRWAAIFGNGYNADVASGASGEAALFIMFLDPDLSDGWTLGKDYLKISTATGSTTNLNGLSSPAIVDMNGDGFADRAYAGDILGNMWVFDIGDAMQSKWGVAYKKSGTPAALFSATSAQPIMVQPAIIKNALVADTATNTPNVLVLFGTGQYLANGDNAALGDQAFYGVWDSGLAATSIKPADLQSQSITELLGVRTLSNNSVDFAVTPGWKIDLTSVLASGERVVSKPVVRGSIVYFNTIIPTNETCSFGGDGYLMSVDSMTGGNPLEVIFDLDGNGKLDDGAKAGVKFEYGLPAAPSFLGNRRYTPGTSTSTGSDIQSEIVESLKTNGTGRISWEELVPQ